MLNQKIKKQNHWKCFCTVSAVMSGIDAPVISLGGLSGLGGIYIHIAIGKERTETQRKKQKIEQKQATCITLG